MHKIVEMLAIMVFRSVSGAYYDHMMFNPNNTGL